MLYPLRELLELEEKLYKGSQKTLDRLFKETVFNIQKHYQNDMQLSEPYESLLREEIGKLSNDELRRRFYLYARMHIRNKRMGIPDSFFTSQGISYLTGLAFERKRRLKDE